MAISGSLNFLSSSMTGSQHIRMNFVGMNTIIVQDIHATSSLDRYDKVPDDVAEGQYGFDLLSYTADNTQLQDLDSGANVLNHILLNRNGPYQHPTFKQIRGAQHPIARKQRLNNTMSIAQAGPFKNSGMPETNPALLTNPRHNLKSRKASNDAVESKWASETTIDGISTLNNSPYRRRSHRLLIYQPVVTSRHKPLIYDIPLQDAENVITARATMNNELEFFAQAVPGGFGTAVSALESPIRKTITLAKGSQVNGVNFLYSETMWPKSLNAYRPEKLQKANYEEEVGLESNGFDRQNPRSFWRQTQGVSNFVETSSASPSILYPSGLTRRRTSYGRLDTAGPAPCINSQGISQIIEFDSSAGVGTGSQPISWGGQTPNNVGTLILTASTTADAHTLRNWWPNGIIAYQRNTMTSSLSGGLPSVFPYQTCITNYPTYQPHDIALLSMWPLDPAEWVYRGYSLASTANRPFTSSLGGRGIHIGLTPHYAYIDNASITGGVMSQSMTTHPAGDPIGAENRINSLITGTAGELVYSTKPTIFYYRSTASAEEPVAPKLNSFKGAQHNLDGYRAITASLQYNRHTFPYNTPFYATNRIRGVDPFYNSYEEFAKNLKFIGRDYSIIPEYRISDNLAYYYDGTSVLDKTTDRETKIYMILSDDDGRTEKNLIKRVYRPQNLDNSNLFKLDFLILDGATVTSSADLTHLSSSTQGKINHISKNRWDSTYVPGADYQDEDDLLSSVKSWRWSDTATKFYERYSHTDDSSTNFAKTTIYFAAGTDTVPAKIKFKAHAIKKLLPYNGFYPMNRTTQLGSHLSQAFGRILDNTTNFNTVTGAINRPGKQNVALQAFLEPLMAPGILYNSIKSGIAVDYPVHTQNDPVYYFSTFFLGKLGVQGLDAQFSSSFNYGGGWAMGASRGIPAILENAPNRRIPFEALYDTSKLDFLDELEEGMRLVTDWIDYDRSDIKPYPLSFYDGDFGTGSSADGTSNFINMTTEFGSARPFMRPRVKTTLKPSTLASVNKYIYEAGMNNFLSEMMDFFLADQDDIPGVKLPVATSKIIPENSIQIKKNRTYYMDISLVMGKDHVMCEGPRHAGIDTGINFETNGSGPAGDQNHRGGATYAKWLNEHHRMRGYIYGPPLEIASATGSWSRYAWSRDLPGGNDTSPTPADQRAHALYLLGHFVGLISASYGVHSHRYQPFTPASAIDANGLHLTSASFDVNEAGQVQQVAFHELKIPAHMPDIYLGTNLQDPAYQAYTPPYFYGDSSLIVKLATGDGTDASLLNYDGKISLSDVVDDATGSFYFEQYNTGSGCLMVPGTSSASSGSLHRMKIEASLDIFNDLALIEPADGSGLTQIVENVWYITPKWICPVLDFSSSIAAIKPYESVDGYNGSTKQEVLSVVTNSFHDIRTGRGLWGGYGTDIYDPQLLSKLNDELQLSEDERQDLDKGLYMQIRNPLTSQEGVIQENTQATFESGINSDKGFFVSRDTSNLAATVEDFGLSKKLGFENKKYTIGKFANSKTVTEAIAIIPYFDQRIDIKFRDGGALYYGEQHTTAQEIKFPGQELFSTREIIPGKHFLPIQRAVFDRILSVALMKSFYEFNHPKRADLICGQLLPDGTDPGNIALKTDVGAMIRNLLGNRRTGEAGFSLPPEFDFIHGNIDPFQMIILPFSHDLNKQELIDIYQGCMPYSTQHAEKAISEISINPSLPNMLQRDDLPFIPRFFPKENGTLEESLSLAPLNLASFLSPLPLVLFDNYVNNKTSGLGLEQRSVLSDEPHEFPYGKSAKGFYENLKFMVFKIKQRSQKDYFSYKTRQVIKTIRNKLLNDQPNGAGKEVVLNDFTPQRFHNKTVGEAYGTNWPYDYFSLIETAKIDIQFEVAE